MYVWRDGEQTLGTKEDRNKEITHGRRITGYVKYSILSALSWQLFSFSLCRQWVPRAGRWENQAQVQTIKGYIVCRIKSNNKTY